MHLSKVNIFIKGDKANLITSDNIESASERIPLTPMYRGGEAGSGEK